MNIADIKPYIEKGLVNENKHPEYPALRIYNYTNKCQIDRAWDEVTLQCRGLIINNDTGEVVARPFPKFFNLEEREHVIPDEEPHIHEKYDGSLGILYWIGEEPYIATRGSFTSEQALWATQWFRRNIKDYSVFHRYGTYLFEIIYPENRIVVSYDFSGLVFLALRDTNTGAEMWQTDLPAAIMMPKKYAPMALEKLKELERNNAEGFVVHYPKTGLRIKLKFEEYKRLHRIVTNVTPRTIWDALRTGIGTKDILDRVPDEFYKWVTRWHNKLQNEYDEIESRAHSDFVKILHNEDKDIVRMRASWRRHFALLAKESKYTSILFAMLDDKQYDQLIWRMLKPKAEDAYKEEI